jgi:hypothetical protein
MKLKLLLIYFTFFFTDLHAEIKVYFPINRAVFQRNNSNEAEINISGSLSRRTDKVEARFTPINGQGVDDGTWHLIQNNAFQGYFIGKVKVKGGWYKLEVRSTLGNSIETSTVEKVGVGEVFIIAGQSNAQGVEDYGSLGAKDDRVNCINAFKELNSFDDIRTDLTISQLTQNTRIAPSGRVAWCWGELGDKLTQRLGVPVLFFNAAWGGTTATNWSESINGKLTNNLIESKYMPIGYPYFNLKFSLNYYASLFGIRAVLWHQGETDTFPGTTTRDKYFNELKSVIDRSRQDFGSNVTWVIAKVSYSATKTSEEVLNGQQQILNLANYNTFAGPSTDNIQIPRPDVVHFQNTATSKGISLLADAWNTALNQSLFVNYIPILAKPIVEFQLKCTNNIRTDIQIPTSHTIQIWNDGSTINLRETTLDKQYFALVKDSKNNFQFTQAFDPKAIDFNLPTPQISSTLQGICQGQTLDLSVNQNYAKYIWNDGIESNNIRTITQQNTFSVRGVNGAGCLSSVSNNFAVTVSPNPAQPQILSNNTKPLICDGELVRLTTTDTQNTLLWSNGATARSLDFSKAGSYGFSVTAQNQFGCKTSSSNYSFTIRPKPDKPIITNNESGLVCEGKTIRLIVNDQVNKLTWNDGETSRIRDFSRIGDYNLAVRVENTFGCQNNSDTSKISIKPIPAKPRIVSNDPLFACEGSKIRLSSSDLVNKIVWSNGSTEKSIELSKIGDYEFFISVESPFGCKSNQSDILKAAIKSSPQKPFIRGNGIFELKLTIPDSISINKYEWLFNDKVIPYNKTTFYARESGSYQARTYKTYSVNTNQSLSCVNFSEIYKHNPVPNFGNIVFYPNPTTNLIYLESKNEVKNTILEIYTANGYLYETLDLNTIDSRKTIDLSKFRKGLYIFRIKGDDLKESKMVVIE